MDHTNTRSDLETGDFTAIRKDLVTALGGDVNAAYIWAHIRFRQQITDGTYRITLAGLTADTGVSPKRLRRVLNVLRDGGWMHWNRASWDDSTNAYTALVPGDEAPRPQKPTRKPQDNVAPINPDKGPKRDVIHTAKRDVIHTAKRAELVEPKGTNLSTVKNLRSKSKNTSPVGDETRAEANRAAILLADKITSNGSKQPTITDTWTTDLERMHRLDNHTWEEIRGAINWSQADPFWKANIRSPKKLRKHFDQMRLQAARTNQPSKIETVAAEIAAMSQDTRTATEIADQALARMINPGTQIGA